jgi:hypothetical protein
MNSTPSLEPPIVQNGSARLILHENVIGTFFAGYKRAMPQLFVIGSFQVSSPRPPIQLPKPGGGTTSLNYRFELIDFDADISPNDKTINGFKDKFNLGSQQAALYFAIRIDLAGDVPHQWTARLVLYVWVEVQANAIVDYSISFQVLDSDVKMDDVANSALLSFLSHLLTDYLGSLVSAVRIQLKLDLGDLGTISVSALDLKLDSMDVQLTLA